MNMQGSCSYLRFSSCSEAVQKEIATRWPNMTDREERVYQIRKDGGLRRLQTPQLFEDVSRYADVK
jgi:hypothetical protein